MKHFFAVLLSMLLLFSVPACGEDALAISGTPPVDTEAAGSQLPEPQVNAAPEIPADAAIVPQTSDVPATPQTLQMDRFPLQRTRLLSRKLRKTRLHPHVSSTLRSPWWP